MLKSKPETRRHYGISVSMSSKTGLAAQLQETHENDAHIPQCQMLGVSKLYRSVLSL